MSNVTVKICDEKDVTIVIENNLQPKQVSKVNLEQVADILLNIPKIKKIIYERYNLHGELIKERTIPIDNYKLMFIAK